MANCVQCGQQIEATAFCPNCGASQQVQAQSQPQVQPQQPFMSEQPYQPQSQQPQPVQPQPQQPQPVQQPYQPQQPMNTSYPYQVPAGAYPPVPLTKDSGSFGWAVLGCFFPIVGLILYLVWRNTKPRCASKAGIGALVGFVLGMIGTFA